MEGLPKRTTLQRFMDRIKPDVIFLQETMVSRVKPRVFFLSIKNDWEVFSIDSVGLLRGILDVWDPCKLNMKEFSIFVCIIFSV